MKHQGFWRRLVAVFLATRWAGPVAAAVLAVAGLVLSGWAGAETPKLQSGAGPAAWAGDLSAIGPADWSYERAGHLLERAGFGGTPEEVARLAALTPEQAVGYLVDYQKIDNSHLPPFVESGIFAPGVNPVLFGCPVFTSIDLGYAKGEAMNIKVKKEPGKRWLQPLVQEAFYNFFADRFEIGRVELWWADRMLNTKRPLEEKMTLFWHGHFATSALKVRDYRMMLQQQDMLRRGATGNLRDLLVGIAQDPAMLVYLDNGQNVKGSPNENFARELMELFSMGIGNYTEKDIREAARAFTGWTNDGVKFVINAELHDNGPKTVLGVTGNFDGQDVIDIILKQEVTARFIARKLYRYLVNDKLTPELETKLADHLRQNHYELKPFLKMLFLSKDFYSQPSYATQIKAPVHLTISTYRKLGLTKVPGIPDYRTTTIFLGQEMFHPPNVAGWEGGAAWVNPATMLARGNFARDVLLPDVDNFQAPEQPRAVVSLLLEMFPQEAKNAFKPKAAKKGQSAVGQLDSNPDYSLRDGFLWGLAKTFGRVKKIPHAPAELDLRTMAQQAGVQTAEEAVDYFSRRFLRLPLEASDRQQLMDFLRRQAGAGALDYSRPELEKALRELVHLILSTPEYQLS